LEGGVDCRFAIASYSRAKHVIILIYSLIQDNAIAQGRGLMAFVQQGNLNSYISDLHIVFYFSLCSCYQHSMKTEE
jgi:hypothetical protein